jgi:hypothetical protein
MGLFLGRREAYEELHYAYELLAEPLDGKFYLFAELPS